MRERILPPVRRYYRPPIDPGCGLALRLLSCAGIALACGLFLICYGSLKARVVVSYVPLGSPSISHSHDEGYASDALSPDMNSPAVKFANSDVSPVADSKPPLESRMIKVATKTASKREAALTKKRYRVVRRQLPPRAMRAFAWAPFPRFGEYPTPFGRY